MASPAKTESGEPFRSTDKSAATLGGGGGGVRLTTVVTVTELLPGFRSGMPLDTLTELVIIAPSAAPGLTFTIMVKVAAVPGYKPAVPQMIEPAPPTSGSRLVQP